MITSQKRISQTWTGKEGLKGETDVAGKCRRLVNTYLPKKQ